MTEKQIWCASGGLSVTLPDEAYNVDLMSSGVKITPCEGCSHSGHLKRVGGINSEVEEAYLLKSDRRPKLIHHVQVFKYLGKEHIQCTCDCYPENVKE